MTKKVFAVLLALLLLLGAAPLVCARPADEGWLIYCARTKEDALAATLVAPAKYTRLSDSPAAEVVFITSGERTVLTPEAEQIRFSSGKAVETRWALTVTCADADERDVRVALLPDCLFDDAGNGNARIFFGDETDYMRAAGYAEIDVVSGLLQRDYSRADETVAVGDTLRVDYSGLLPIEILVNGETLAALPGGELQRVTCAVTEPGALNIVVRQDGKTVETRSLTVVSSAEMYRRNLRDGLITGAEIPDTEDFVQVGLPRVLVPFAKAASFLVLLREFFYRLFSFSRIAK